MGAIRTHIIRDGVECDVLSDVGITEDVLNNRTSDFQLAGTTWAIRYHPDDSRVVETDTGSYEVSSVRFALPGDTIAKTGDRLVYDGIVYELRVVEPRGDHAEADGKLIPN